MRRLFKKIKNYVLIIITLLAFTGLGLAITLMDSNYSLYAGIIAVCSIVWLFLFFKANDYLHEGQY